MFRASVCPAARVRPRAALPGRSAPLTSGVGLGVTGLCKDFGFSQGGGQISGARTGAGRRVLP